QEFSIMCSRVFLGVVTLACALAPLPITGANAANIFELNFWLSGPRYEGQMPTCNAPWTLSKVAARFGEKENSFWQSELAIVDIVNVRETAFRPGPPNSIPRR